MPKFLLALRWSSSGTRGRLFEINREIGLLEPAELDTGVDGVAGVLQDALAARKLLRSEEFLRIIAEFCVAESPSNHGVGWAKRFAGFGPDGFEICFEEIPGNGLRGVVEQRGADLTEILIFYGRAKNEFERAFGQLGLRKLS
jgi:hypothetical protein